MRYMTFIYFTLFLVSFLACKDAGVDIPCSEDPCAVDACDPEKCVEGSDSTFMGLDTLWASEADLIRGNIQNVAQSSNLVFVNLILTQGHEVLAFDKNIGELLWRFNNPDAPYFSDMYFHEGSQRLLLQSDHWITAVNVLTGEMISDAKPESYSASSTYGSLIGNYYYLPVRSEDKTSGYVLQSHVGDLLEWEEVYKIKESEVNGNRPSINGMNVWIHPETSDEILLLQHRMAFPKRIDLVAYNMTADSMYWWHKDIEPVGNSNIRQIQIFKDRAYFQGSRTIHAVNMIDGSYQWKYEGGESDFSCCHSIIYAYNENLIIDNYTKDSDDSGLMAWDADNGSVQWLKNVNNYQDEGKEYYKSFVIQADGYLRVYHAGSGILIKELADTERRSGFGGVLIDEDNEVMYTLYGNESSTRYLQLIAVTIDSVVE